MAQRGEIMKVKFDYFTDLVDVLIKDESKILGEKFIINEEKLNKTKLICELISDLENEISFDELDARFNETTGYLEFKIVLGYFSITSQDSAFYKLLDKAIKFKVYTAEKGETMELYFAFGAVWDYLD